MKPIRPPASVREAPKRSDSVPLERRSAAKITTYPSTIHSSPANPACSWCPIDGKATFTTVVSSTITKKPTQAASNAARRGLDSLVPAGWVRDVANDGVLVVVVIGESCACPLSK